MEPNMLRAYQDWLRSRWQGGGYLQQFASGYGLQPQYQSGGDELTGGGNQSHEMKRFIEGRRNLNYDIPPGIMGVDEVLGPWNDHQIDPSMRGAPGGNGFYYNRRI